MPVNTEHKAYAVAKAWWERCGAVAEGSDAVKAAGTKFLPQLKGQDQADYDEYKARAFFYNATGRTLAGLIGAICRKDPTTEGVPVSMAPHLKDVTLEGVSMPAFAMRSLDAVLTKGRGGVLVDLPDAPAPGAKGPARPYWQMYDAEQIVNWRVTQFGGDSVLTRVVLRESVEKADDKDAFKAEMATRYRVLELTASEDGKTLRYSVTLWTRRDGAAQGATDEWVAGTPVYPTRKAKALERIPFVFLGPFGIGPEVYRPPILDLVDANLSHYRTSADYEHGCHYCGIPTPYTTGWADAPKELPLGPTKAWHISDASGTAGMLEFTGQGLGALEKNLERKERLMAVLGARLLETPKTGVEAADTVRLRHAGEQASLKTVAMAVGLSLTEVMKLHAWWDGHDEAITDGILVSLNQEFFALTLSPEEVKTAMLAWQGDAMSFETFFWKLSQGGWARPGVTAEEERAAIDAGGGDPKDDPAGAAV